jgi:hypothetical protein
MRTELLQHTRVPFNYHEHLLAARLIHKALIACGGAIRQRPCTGMTLYLAAKLAERGQ